MVISTHRHITHEHKMLGKPLTEVKEDKALRLIISNDLKYGKQYLSAFNKAKRMLGFIARNISYKTNDTILISPV